MSPQLQDGKFTLPDVRLISQKHHVFQSITQNPGEFYEEAQNAANKLEIKGIWKGTQDQSATHLFLWKTHLHFLHCYFVVSKSAAFSYH
jgi:hypothetical protein